MRLWYDSDTAFTRRVVEFFHLAEYWPLYLAALVVIIAANSALRKIPSKDARSGSQFWGWAGVVAIVFAVLFLVLHISGYGLTDKVKLPRVPDAVTRVVDRSQDQHQDRPQKEEVRLNQNLSQSHGQAQNRRADMNQLVDVVQIPIWHDGIAVLVSLLTGGVLWRRKQRFLGTVGALGLSAIYALFRDNFAGGNWQLTEIIKAIFVIVLFAWVYWRMRQAQKEGQWLVTVNPQTRQPARYKVLLINDQRIIFLVFHALLALLIVFSETMFRAWWLALALSGAWAWLSFRILNQLWQERKLFWTRLALASVVAAISFSFVGLVFVVVMAGLYLLSTYIKLEAAQKFNYEWAGADVYDPQFYFWSREDGKDTVYRDDPEFGNQFLVMGSYKCGFRKGTKTGLISPWLPSNFVRGYFYAEESLEIDTFKCKPYPTVQAEWPDTDKFDGLNPTDLKNIGESGPEVEVEINLSVYKYLNPSLYLPMADEDRKDEVNFVKRKVIEPAVARFLGRMTMDQAVTAKLLKSQRVKFMMDGELVTFAQYLNKMLRPYGWALKNVEVGDCQQPEAIRQAQEALKAAETAVKTAVKEAEKMKALARGEGDKLLEVLSPLATALKSDPTLAVVMDHYRTLQLYSGDNKILGLVPNQAQVMSSLADLVKALSSSGGGTPPTP